MRRLQGVMRGSHLSALSVSCRWLKGFQHQQGINGRYRSTECPHNTWKHNRASGGGGGITAARGPGEPLPPPPHTKGAFARCAHHVCGVVQQ